MSKRCDSHPNAALQLESFTSLRQLLCFIFRTYDGCYLVALSIIFLLWGGANVILSEDGVDMNSAGLLLYPGLLLVVYLRHRIGTRSSARLPSILSFVSLTAISLVPVYINYWR